MIGGKVVQVIDGETVITDNRPIAEARAERAAMIEAEVQARIDAAHAALDWDREGANLRAHRLTRAKLAGPLSTEMQQLDAAMQWLDAQIDAAQAARAVALAAIEAAATNAEADAVTL